MLGTTATAGAAMAQTLMFPASCAVGVTVAADASVPSTAVAGRAKGQAGIRTLPLFQVFVFLLLRACLLSQTRRSWCLRRRVEEARKRKAWYCAEEGHLLHPATRLVQAPRPSAVGNALVVKFAVSCGGRADQADVAQGLACATASPCISPRFVPSPLRRGVSLGWGTDWYQAERSG
jgi:hypothetical protein